MSLIHNNLIMCKLYFYKKGPLFCWFHHFLDSRAERVWFFKNFPLVPQRDPNLKKNLPWGTKGKSWKKQTFFGNIWFGHFDRLEKSTRKMVSLIVLPIGNQKRRWGYTDWPHYDQALCQTFSLVFWKI